ncbi:pentapeptide repeat-containing protein [Streptomyces sp. CA-288835]|uniref:pentapeptide repeat-containing protein n=1 Tax=Streptomyces sp. CA-288835 TaxID=3240069 RepID=UPI003D9272DA
MGHARLNQAQFLGITNLSRVEFQYDADFDEAEFADVFFTGSEFHSSVSFHGANVRGVVRFDEVVFHRSVDFMQSRVGGSASFLGARFKDFTLFEHAEICHNADFSTAQFDEMVSFASVRITGTAEFQRATFTGTPSFDDAKFMDHAVFDGAQFLSRTLFLGSVFSAGASFRKAQFADSVDFDGSRIVGDIGFQGAEFAGVSDVGPLVCAGCVDLSGAVFALPVTLEISACDLVCNRTRWESTAVLRVRYASIDLADAVLSAPLAVTSQPVPFSSVPTFGAMDETLLDGRVQTASVTSVRGVDASHLVLTDTDLKDCLFTGAFHLNQIRLEGRTVFPSVPKGFHRRNHAWPTRWSQRRTLAEEHHWRAQAAHQAVPIAGQSGSEPARQWRTGPHHGDPARTPDPEDVAAVYRQLRQAFEDGKNEPGAADFYYGEMEMRRHDHDATPRGERGLLHGYWLLSGYGLRASRALLWLLAAMSSTILLLMGLGLPQHSPKQEASAIVPAGGGPVTFTIDKDDPQNPTGDRFTGKRFEKALNVTLNSVVFRSSGQDLTTAGTYIEMTSRLLEPALLALAVLAVRGRIKR